MAKVVRYSAPRPDPPPAPKHETYTLRERRNQFIATVERPEHVAVRPDAQSDQLVYGTVHPVCRASE